MTVVLGILLGLGLTLAASPWLWPAREERPRETGRLRDLLVQAGLARVTVPTFVVVSVLLGAVAAGLVAAIVPVVVLAVAAGLVGAALPTVLVVARARSARRTTRIVWPDVVDHLVSAVRSGLALPDSVVALAHTGPPATRAAFAEFEADYRATGDFPASIDRLKQRLADPVADRILETLRMSREVGGTELTGVLRALASYLRADAAVRSEVEARQSWVVVAARLGVAAPWIVLLLLSTRPEAAAAYNSASGSVVVAIGLAISVVAYRIMLAVGRLPEERRWFE
ncbi:type II secretion system F family protein [Galbitalea sp. SE-J8]|uniref:type II secretion system F family protein n=1 Tax=Galbitalea sp. SE-J8 TaxID=3054952 RepID=UPI00259C7E36|nr:type II secretion system F family protein [Galbitalea sp. SE-J8]MDM4763567.1 type II secretion system F family protein [Galbitalea sp. SE-J8]